MLPKGMPLTTPTGLQACCKATRNCPHNAADPRTRDAPSPAKLDWAVWGPQEQREALRSAAEIDRLVTTAIDYGWLILTVAVNTIIT